VIKDGTSNTNSPYLKIFPYLGTPAGGYQTLPGTPKVNAPRELLRATQRVLGAVHVPESVAHG